MKIAAFIGVLLASVFLCAWKAVEARRELAASQARATVCEETAKLADKVILTCLSWQVVVKMEIESLERRIQGAQQ